MIPRLNDFIEMASVLEETYSGMDLNNMVIEFSVSKGILQKINEESDASLQKSIHQIELLQALYRQEKVE